MTAEQERAFIRTSERRIWRITTLAAVAILCLGLAVTALVQGHASSARATRHAEEEQKADAALQRQQAADLACVKRWADAYTRRADRLSALSQPRADALDRLAASIPAHDPVLFRKRLDEYLAASVRYKAEQAANPLPPSPTFACGLTPHRGPAPYVPSATPVPVPSPRPSKTPSTSRRPSTPDASRTAAAAARPNLAPVAPRPGGPSSRARATATRSSSPTPAPSPTFTGPLRPLCTLPALPPLVAPISLC